MTFQQGIQVHLKDRNGNTIKTTAGRIIAAPGDKFQIFITISTEFEWYGAYCLYVEIASRDATAMRTRWNGDETQVLCISKDAPHGVHKISEMKLWDLHFPGKEPSAKAFSMPPPYYESNGIGTQDDKAPDLQARRGCVQVSFRRGHLSSGNRTFKKRPADPHATRDDGVECKDHYQYIIPSWFKPLPGIRGERIVFQFKNTSSETVVDATKETGVMEESIQHAVTTTMMQEPAAVKPEPDSAKKHTSKQQLTGARQISTRLSSTKKTPPQKLKPQTAAHQPVESESEEDDDDDGIFELAPTRLSVPKRSEQESAASRKIKMTVTPRHVSSKREREPGTPSPKPIVSSRFAQSLATPSSARSMTPMSSQKKRKIELLELQLKEIRLQKQLLELADDAEES